MPGFIVKAKYGSECRRFPVKSSQLIFSYLEHEIRSRFSIAASQKIAIFFTDGNLNVPIRNDAELSSYCVLNEQFENTLLRFKVEAENPSKNSSSSSTSSSSFGVPIPPNRIESQTPPLTMDSVHLSQIENPFEKKTQTSQPQVSPDFLAFWQKMGNSLIDMVKSVENGQNAEEAMKQSFTQIQKTTFETSLPLNTENNTKKQNFDLTEQNVSSKMELDSAPQKVSCHSHAISKTTSKNPDFIRIHSGVVCDNCESRIVGIRYKCGHCIDYDLCSNCEEYSTHNPNHLFIKIKEPIPHVNSSPFWAKLPLLPPLPVSQKSSIQQPTPSIQQPTPSIQQPTQQQSTPPSIPFFSTVPIKKPKVETIQSKPKPVEKKRYVVPHNGRFVRDVTIDDGFVVKPSQELFKTWEMINNGKFAWQVGTRLVYVGGDVLSEENSVVVPLAAPGEKVNVTVPMKAPQNQGRYTSYWRLVNPTNGNRFGDRLWCDINVVEEEEEQLPTFESLSDLNQALNVEQMSINSSEPILVDVSDVSPVAPTCSQNQEEQAPAYYNYETETYGKELSQLNEMGFYNQELNHKLLLKHNGDLSKVIPTLLEEMDNNWFTSRNFVQNK